MADGFQGGSGRGGGKKPFPKTFGDVMKGIPSGGGAHRPSEERREARPGGEQSDRRRDRPRRSEEARRGPVVVRKPPPLTAPKPAQGADAPALAGAPAAGPAAPAASPKGPGAPRGRAEPRRSPKTVFRRADALNLPPAPPAAEPLPEPVEVEESFAELFAASEKEATPKRFEIGQKVSGRIVKIGHEAAFLDLGGKGEGMIDLAELKDSHGNIMVAVGEILEGYVLALSGGVVVTKALSKGAQREFLHEASVSGIPVEGLVTGHNKGGLEVDLGGLRGFCPASQIDLRFVENPGELVGQRLMFRVTEVKERDVVLSRRALLEAEAAKKAAELRESLQVGSQLEGRVTSVRDFGAFVDLGGLEGLVHVSEMGYGRVTNPKDVLQVGQTVKVEVVRIDPPKEGEKTERIALSMKALQQDPWQEAASRFAEGDRVTGKVVRLQPFGAFIELMPGVDGLAHISALGAPRRIAHPREVLNEGDEVTVVIESMDLAQKRISLRRVNPDEAEEAPSAAPSARAAAQPRVGDVYEVTVDKVETFGIFVKLPNGRGLVPNAELGTPKGADHRKLFPPGTTFQAQVVEIDAQGRLRLSKVAAEQAAERAEYGRFMEKQAKASGKGFGTLGDLLKLKK